MSGAQLWSKLSYLGVELSAEAGQLHVRARPGVITPSLQSEIAHSKEALLALLETKKKAAQEDGFGLVRMPRNGELPLSFFQERLWVLQRLDPQSTAFNMVSMWRSERPTTTQERLERVRTLVRKHEVLHTIIDGEGEIPVARLAPPDSVSIEVVDLTNLMESEQLRRLENDGGDATRRPFDLASEPAVRFAIYDVGQGRVVTLMAAHHIVVDAWSLALVKREIEFPETLRDASDAARLQYWDYAAWQRRLHDADDMSDSLEWWAQRLSGIPQLSALPADYRPAQSSTGAFLPFFWDKSLSDGVRAYAQEHGATLYMALVAACAAVLGRHAHQDDIVLGSPTGVREFRELETMVGPFVNLLVLRFDLADDPTFTELLSRARTEVLDAYEHRHTAFEKLVERMRPARTLNRSPIFQVAVVLHNATVDGDTEVHGGGAIHDMTWFARETKDGIKGSVEYRTDIYSSATIERTMRHLETFLRSAISAPSLPISKLALTSPEERRLLIAMGKSEAMPMPIDPAPFPDQFERQVRQAPDRCAVSFEGVALTYDELNRRANRIARHLTASGAGKGRRVGVCLQRGLDLLATLIAIQKCGAAYLPLDPKHPTERRTYILEDSGCAVLVVDAKTQGDCQAFPGLHFINIDDDAEIIASLDDGDLSVQTDSSDPVYMIYTSGSTGKPKGVIVSHGNLANMLGSVRQKPGLSSEDVFAAVTTISFDIAGLELYLPLLVGARIELVDTDVATDGDRLKGKLAFSGATIMQATPATWRLLIEADWQGGQSFRALCGGESLPRDLANDLLDRAGALWNMYGPTETTVWSTVERIEAGETPVSIGRPIANTEIYILDRSDEPAPVGVPGEIAIGGEGVAIGYHNRHDLTVQRFTTDHLSGRPEGRLYRTGDLGAIGEDGRFYHLGRLDTQVKLRGMRIELGEIESVLRQMPEVQTGVVQAHETTPGEGRLVAYVVTQPGEDLTVSDVRQHLRRSLPDYMIPSFVITIDSIPLTPNGKIDRAALPDPFKSGGRTRTFEPPAPGIEQQIAEIWREFLSVDSIAADDNFFELGGQSILSLRVVAAIQRRTGHRIDPRSLFFQSLRQVAANVSSAPVFTRGGA